MLNLPAAIQALFRLDSVRKNFRAHFPNGERADILNTNVVKDSAKFTESLCSQEALKFGLTEASMLELETVGVENIKGAAIQCSLEIETTSLTAAQISAIQAGSWDGELVLAADSDLGFGFYRVPLGLFRVDSCPRNQQAMTHRRIKAYSIGPGADAGNPFELEKLSLLLPGGNSYAPNAKAFLYAALGYNSADLMTAGGYSKTLLSPSMPGTTEQNRSMTLTLSGGTTQVFEAHYKRDTYSINYGGADLYAVDTQGYDYAGTPTAVAAWLDGLGVDPAASGFDNMAALVNRFVGDLFAPCIVYGSGAYVLDTAHALTSNEAILPFRPGVSAVMYRPTLFYLMTLQPGGGGIVTLNRTPGTPADWYAQTDTAAAEALDNLSIAFPATLEQARSFPSGYSGTCWSYTDAVNLLDYVNGFLELSGSFGRTNRDGEIVFTRLSNASPEAIGPGDTAEFWWEEGDVAPIGSVVYTYKDSDDKDQTGTCLIGSGSGQYDMTDNAVLKALTSPTVSAIEALLLSTFAPAAAGITYTPVQLDIRALPWIEAGDALTVTAEDGTTVNTYAMRHEINGIQALFAAIESSGDIG